MVIEILFKFVTLILYPLLFLLVFNSHRKLLTQWCELTTFLKNFTPKVEQLIDAQSKISDNKDLMILCNNNQLTISLLREEILALKEHLASVSLLVAKDSFYKGEK